MFKVTADPQFVEDVAVEMADGTGWTVQNLRTRFRMLPDAEILALTSDQLVDVGGVMERAVVGFEDLGSDDGPVDAAEWRGTLLGYRCVQMALFRKYSEAMVRRALGNSASSGGAGPPAGQIAAIRPKLTQTPPPSA